MTGRTKIAIVEDHALTRAGMKTALAGTFDVCAEAADGITGFAEIVRAKPDVAIVDLGLPGIDGIELTRRLREAVPQMRVVIVTMSDIPEEVVAALAAGADAYCLKSSPVETLVDAVRITRDGGAYFDPKIAHVVLSRFAASRAPSEGESPLTPRETEVLRMIADGTANAEIAAALGIGFGTVKGHVRDILEKLSAADRTHAAVTALRRGLI